MISWASNPVRGVSHSWVGSTPAVFRHIQGSQQPLKAPQGAFSLGLLLIYWFLTVSY